MTLEEYLDDVRPNRIAVLIMDNEDNVSVDDELESIEYDKKDYNKIDKEILSMEVMDSELEDNTMEVWVM